MPYTYFNTIKKTYEPIEGAMDFAIVQTHTGYECHVSSGDLMQELRLSRKILDFKLISMRAFMDAPQIEGLFENNKLLSREFSKEEMMFFLGASFPFESSFFSWISKKYDLTQQPLMTFEAALEVLQEHSSSSREDKRYATYSLYHHSVVDNMAFFEDLPLGLLLRSDDFCIVHYALEMMFPMVVHPMQCQELVVYLDVLETLLTSSNTTIVDQALNCFISIIAHVLHAQSMSHAASMLPQLKAFVESATSDQIKRQLQSIPMSSFLRFLRSDDPEQVDITLSILLHLVHDDSYDQAFVLDLSSILIPLLITKEDSFFDKEMALLSHVGSKIPFDSLVESEALSARLITFIVSEDQDDAVVGHALSLLIYLQQKITSNLFSPDTLFLPLLSLLDINEKSDFVVENALILLHNIQLKFLTNTSRVSEICSALTQVCFSDNDDIVGSALDLLILLDEKIRHKELDVPQLCSALVEILRCERDDHVNKALMVLLSLQDDIQHTDLDFSTLCLALATLVNSSSDDERLNNIIFILVNLNTSIMYQELFYPMLRLQLLQLKDSHDDRLVDVLSILSCFNLECLEPLVPDLIQCCQSDNELVVSNALEILAACDGREINSVIDINLFMQEILPRLAWGSTDVMIHLMKLLGHCFAHMSHAIDLHVFIQTNGSNTLLDKFDMLCQNRNRDVVQHALNAFGHLMTNQINFQTRQHVSMFLPSIVHRLMTLMPTLKTSVERQKSASILARCFEYDAYCIITDTRGHQNIDLLFALMDLGGSGQEEKARQHAIITAVCYVVESLHDSLIDRTWADETKNHKIRKLIRQLHGARSTPLISDTLQKLGEKNETLSGKKSSKDDRFFSGSGAGAGAGRDVGHSVEGSPCKQWRK